MKNSSISKVFMATDWHKKWVVQNYSILSSSFMFQGYHAESLKAYGFSLKHNVFVQHGSAIVCYQSLKENENFGKLIAEKIKNKKILANQLAKEALHKTRVLRNICKKSPSWLWQKDYFKSFNEQYAKLLPPFIAIIRSGNYLMDKKFAKEFKTIQKARIKTETIYDELDLFIRKSLGYLAKKNKINANKLPLLTLDELRGHIFHHKPLPITNLKKRKSLWGLCFIGNKEYILNPQHTKSFEKMVINSFKPKKGRASGQIGYPGLTRGKARVILHPKNAKFNQGDILITGMTRPEFLPIMKKAAAIVTDAGGALCHAAIVARELKIPCIIGTQTATSAFKDGDMVEVDANKGVIIKKT